MRLTSKLCKAAVPNLFGTRDQLRGRQFFHGPGVGGVGVEEDGDGSGGNASNALLTCPPLTSCCAAWFITGHELVLIRGPGVGDLWCKEYDGCFIMSLLLCYMFANDFEKKSNLSHCAQVLEMWDFQNN